MGLRFKSIVFDNFIKTNELGWVSGCGQIQYAFLDFPKYVIKN